MQSIQRPDPKLCTFWITHGPSNHRQDDHQIKDWRMIPKLLKYGKRHLEPILGVWHRVMTKQDKKAQIWCLLWHTQRQRLMLQWGKLGANGLMHALWSITGQKRGPKLDMHCRSWQPNYVHGKHVHALSWPNNFKIVVEQHHQQKWGQINVSGPKKHFTWQQRWIITNTWKYHLHYSQNGQKNNIIWTLTHEMDLYFWK